MLLQGFLDNFYWVISEVILAFVHHLIVAYGTVKWSKNFIPRIKLFIFLAKRKILLFEIHAFQNSHIGDLQQGQGVNKFVSSLIFVRFDASYKMKLAIFARDTSDHNRALFLFLRLFCVLVKLKQRFSQLNHQILHLIRELCPYRFLIAKFLFSAWCLLHFLLLRFNDDSSKNIWYIHISLLNHAWL